MYLHHDTAATIVSQRTGARRAAADRHRLTRRNRHSVRNSLGGVDTLTDRVATDGPAAVEAELATCARFARRRGVSPTLVDIVGDPDQPAVARQRAFARIAGALANRTTGGCCDDDRVAA